jgi:hypothetical protein
MRVVISMRNAAFKAPSALKIPGRRHLQGRLPSLRYAQTLRVVTPAAEKASRRANASLMRCAAVAAPLRSRRCRVFSAPWALRPRGTHAPSRKTLHFTAPRPAAAPCGTATPYRPSCVRPRPCSFRGSAPSSRRGKHRDCPPSLSGLLRRQDNTAREPVAGQNAPAPRTRASTPHQDKPRAGTGHRSGDYAGPAPRSGQRDRCRRTATQTAVHSRFKSRSHKGRSTLG